MTNETENGFFSHGNRLAEEVTCEPCGNSIDESASSASSQNIDGDVETTLWTGHPSYLAYMALYILGVVFIILGSLYYSHLFWIIVIGVFLIINPIIDRKSKVYTVTNIRIKAKANIYRYIAHILIKDITSIDLQSHAAGKLFGLGAIRIIAEVEEEMKVGIVFKGISNPQRIIEIIEGLRTNYKNHQHIITCDNS